MAAQNNNRIGFYEMVLAGPPVLIHGLLAGMKMGAGEKGRIFFSLDERIAGPRITDKVREFIRVHPRECHVVVESGVRSLIKRKAKAIAAECDVEVVSEKRVRKAGFRFAYHAFAPRYAREIKAALRDLPRGLKLEDMKVEETRDPKAKGIESYTPAHDFESSGSGRVVGRVDRVIEARDMLDAHPLVQTERIELELA